MKKHYNKFSSAVRQQAHNIETEREIITNETNQIYSFNQRNFSSSDLSQKSENVTFIDSTSAFVADLKCQSKHHIEQSFDNVSPADDLIDQSAKQDQKHLLAANITILSVRDTQDQKLEFSSHQTTNRQSYKIH